MQNRQPRCDVQVDHKITQRLLCVSDRGSQRAANLRGTVSLTRARAMEHVMGNTGAPLPGFRPWSDYASEGRNIFCSMSVRGARRLTLHTYFAISAYVIRPMSLESNSSTSQPLSSGRLGLPRDIGPQPVFEWRSGFHFSLLDEAQDLWDT